MNSNSVYCLPTISLTGETPDSLDVHLPRRPFPYKSSHRLWTICVEIHLPRRCRSFDKVFTAIHKSHLGKSSWVRVGVELVISLLVAIVILADRRLRSRGCVSILIVFAARWTPSSLSASGEKNSNISPTTTFTHDPGLTTTYLVLRCHSTSSGSPHTCNSLPLRPNLQYGRHSHNRGQLLIPRHS